MHIDIGYSRGPCDLKLSSLGLPEWTVEKVYYSWPMEKKPSLAEILLQREQFKKHADHTLHDTYTNDEFGIRIVHDRKRKKVLDIVLDPSAKLTEKYACSKTE